MDQIAGYVERIVFVQEDSGFTIAKIKENKKKDLTTIVGVFPNIQPGETLHCEGTWKNHKTFGKQFEVSNCTIRSPSDLVGIQKYLESGLVKGIGPCYAEKIVNLFGLDTLLIIDQAPKRLLEVSGIGKKRIEKIIECWSSQKSIREVMIFLRSYDISPSYAQKSYKRYEEKAIEIVKNNPYQLAKDIFGIGFKIADKIALQMGFEKDSAKRIQAGIEHVLWELSNDGHTCYPEEDFYPEAEKILDTSKSIIKPQVDILTEHKQLVKSNGFIWIKPLHFYEEEIAKELIRLSKAPCFLRKVDTKKAVSWVEEKVNLSLEKNQKIAVENGVSKKLQIITGGPGTGKSTITKAILTITEKLTNKILLAAPTGRAAKRMTQITKKKAFTIHALLEFDFLTGKFKRTPDNPLKCHLFIIDESSMIDTQLMYSLLRAIPDTCRVILIGDIDQLPSVGPGNVLRDMIASDQIFVSSLTEIFRQAKGSKIITNAHKINQGEFPDLYNPKYSDFHFFEANEPEEIQNIIVELIKDKIPEKKRFDRMNDIQVLCPMKRGIIGTENLNVVLQNALNPSSTPFYRGGSQFHVGDKVMQIQNDYDKNVFNGDVGKIETIDIQEQQMLINFEGSSVAYDFSELDEITLAYAVSIHKYQGSECPCIVIPMHTSHFILLHRNLLYTGVTRGKKLVILVGTKQAISIAVRNNEVKKRHTGLQESIKKEMLYPSDNQQTLLPGFSF